MCVSVGRELMSWGTDNECHIDRDGGRNGVYERGEVSGGLVCY